MGEEMITTGVDELIAYLRGKDRVALQDAATVLGLPMDTLQAWVDFLVEEKILGLEYRFTKPFVYLNRDSVDAGVPHERALTLQEMRALFVEHARSKRIPDEKIVGLWHTHVINTLNKKQTYFIDQAMRRSLPDPEHAWQTYREDLLVRCTRG